LKETHERFVHTHSSVDDGALQAAGMLDEDIGLWELHEAF
jgi:hypothetical protein